MIRVVRFFVGLLALDARGQRAVEAAFADWRHELAGASTARRLIIHVRSIVGVVRTLANAGLTEVPSAWASPFMLKLAAIVVLWVIWMLKDGPPGTTDRFFLVTGQAKAWSLVAASLLPQLLVMLPLMVFLAEAVGRRHRVTPVIGTGVLLAFFGLLMGLVLLPASWAYLRYETWRHFANASVPRPEINALFLPGLSILPTMFAVVGVWLLFAFANRIRRVGGVTGWAIGLGTVLAAYFVGALATALAGATLRTPALRYDLWIALTLSRPLWMLAAVLWATHRLARIDAARLASTGAVNS